MERKNEGDDEINPYVFRIRHYSVAEVAELWKLSEDSVRRLFEHERDVIVMGARPLGSGRSYRTLRLRRKGDGANEGLPKVA